MQLGGGRSIYEIAYEHAKTEWGLAQDVTHTMLHKKQSRKNDACATSGGTHFVEPQPNLVEVGPNLVDSGPTYEFG